MTVTITEISETAMPINQLSGSSVRKRKSIFVRATSTSSADTIDLSSYADLTAVEGPRYESWDESAVNTSGTQSTWSNTTVTLAGQTGSGRYAAEWVVYE